MFPKGMGLRPLSDGRALLAGELDAFEAALRLSLPDDYRQFLLQHNGGHPLPEYWGLPVVWRPSLAAHNQRLALTTLYGLVPEHTNGLDNWRDNLEFEIPPDALPIGDAASPVFLLMLAGKRRGQVLVYLPDSWPEQDQTDPDQLGVAAASFSEFLAKLSHTAPD